MSAVDRNRVVFSAIRLLVSLVGLAAIAWVASVVSIFRLDSYVAKTATRVISGDRFRDDAWDLIEINAKDLAYSSIRPSSVAKLAVIQLRGAERVLPRESGQQAQSRLSEQARLVEDALRNTPGDGFLWLTLFWVSDRNGATANDKWRFLRRSYELSPNEGWIGLKRNPIVLDSFATLPDDIAENAMQELTHLVHSGLHAEAAKIIAGPGLPVNKLLLRRLRALGPVDRAALARDLSNRDGFEDVAKELGVDSAAPYR